MSRPTKEQVEAALEAADRSSYVRAFGGPSHFDILGDEVRALREQLARVEALPEKWKARITADHWPHAACELEDTLKGGA